jgi:hypothetical protein
MKRYVKIQNTRAWRRRVAVAIVVAGAFAVVAITASARIAGRPGNTSAPTISGTTQVGSTLTADNGVWTGSTPITYQYQWRRCGPNGGSCANMPGQTSSTYAIVAADLHNTLRVQVTASNSSGSGSAVSIPTPRITNPPGTTTTATTTTPTTTTAPPATGCPSATGTVPVAEISPPARLQVDQFQATPPVIPGSMSSFTLRVVVTDTCGQTVQGALVYATAVPFGQVSIPAQAATGPDGSATLSFSREGGFPATSRQTLMVMFVRASKPGDNILAGITTGRLISIPVRLRG